MTEDRLVLNGRGAWTVFRFSKVPAGIGVPARLNYFEAAASSKKQKRRPRWSPLSFRFAGLERLNIFSLQALGTFGDFELHRLALL